jgi:hypothetical protein
MKQTKIVTAKDTSTLLNRDSLKLEQTQYPTEGGGNYVLCLQVFEIQCAIVISQYPRMVTCDYMTI